MWVLTVPSAMNRFLEISALVAPAAICSRTSFSRSVSNASRAS